MDDARYYVALMLVLFLPPAVGLWYLIHPFAAFWRRLGPVLTYLVLIGPVFLLGYATYQVRGVLVGTDFGTNPVTIALGVVAAVFGARVAFARRKLLTQRILVGVPELSTRDPGTLLTTGIYGRIRHPRYVEIVLFVLAYALFANHLGGYAVAALSVPALYLVIVLEERELRQRFGEAHAAYCRKVPMCIPRPRTRE